MEKENIVEKDYCEKVQILKSVFSEYNKALFWLKDIPQTYHSPMLIRENAAHYNEYEHRLLQRISKMNHYQEFIDYIDEKIRYLPETERMIIENDFINKKSKRWWDLYFSSATYYRHKKKAVERLIILLFS